MKTDFQIDSGVISETLFHTLGTHVKLMKTKVKVYAYGSTDALPVVDCFDGVIDINARVDIAKFYVVRGDRMGSLMGLESALKLGVITIIDSITGIHIFTVAPS